MVKDGFITKTGKYFESGSGGLIEIYCKCVLMTGVIVMNVPIVIITNAFHNGKPEAIAFLVEIIADETIEYFCAVEWLIGIGNIGHYQFIFIQNYLDW
jgi:hypothetical protein